MILFFKNNKYIFLLLVIALASHLQWFNPFSILNSSDWSYWPNEAVNQLYYSYGAWVNFFDFGSANIQLPFNFFNSIWSVFTNLGLSYDFATKVTFLIPIALLGFIAPYILAKKLTKNELISFILALFYGTTTYFLILQTAHMPIAFVYALTPLLFYFFVRALERNKLANWLIFILIYLISICYEIRITYIVTFLLLFYFLFFHISDIKKYWKNIIVGILLFASLNIFWLLPTILGGFSSDISSVANRGLFGNFLFDINHSFALFYNPWTGGLANNQFIEQPIIWYFWLAPLIAFSSLFFKRNVKYKKEISFFLAISLIGIFLTKQADFPLSGTYLWLYNNFPGFNLFREASKFYLITAIGYTALLGYVLLVLKENKNKIWNKYVFSVLSLIIITTSLWNIKPLVTGEIGTMFVQKHIPSDYVTLKDFILKQPEYFRTMWVPRDSRWGIYTNSYPKVSDINTIQSSWLDLSQASSSAQVQEQIVNILQQPFSKTLFDISSIKYVIIPIQDKANDDDFFVYYGGDKDPNIRQWYIDQLDKVSWLKKIDIGTKDLVVYENANYKESISSFTTLYSLDSFNNLDAKYNFISNQLNGQFYFTTPETKTDIKPTTNILLPFENLGAGDISTNNTLTATTSLDIQKKNTLYNMGTTGGSIRINGSPISNSLKIPLALPTGEDDITYQNTLYPLGNIIPNGSFESGTWQPKVGDCNNADKSPILAMSLNKKEKSEGTQSLQLEATHHIACTAINIPVKAGASYLFSFDYQSPNAATASYYLGFNDTAKTVLNASLSITDTSWHTLSQTITVPDGATTLSLFIYARESDGKTNNINRYDNFKLIEIPDISNSYYLVSQPKATLQQPASTTFEIINPTKKLVHIKGATTPFFLAMSESYDMYWQLELNDTKVQGFLNSWWPFAKPDAVPSSYHYQLDGFLNAWYVDTSTLCAAPNASCTKNADGSYDIEMVIEFWPQRWFYLGLLISGATLASCLGYLGYDFYKRRKLKVKDKK